MIRHQRTLREKIQFEGIGLHTGYSVKLSLVPAPPDTGIRFRRTDLKNFEIEAIRNHVAKVSYATTLMKKGVMISTVERLLATLCGLGIVNNHLRFPNEFVRHKLLDLLGDISLAGYPIIGHLHAERAGHAIHTALADKIARLKTHYRICTADELEPTLTTAAM